MSNDQLTIKLKKIISNEIHLRKCNMGDKLPTDAWQMLPSDEMADAILSKILPTLEVWAYLPCCHVSGMHNPGHFEERKNICANQKADAFERFCGDLGINPETKSRQDCGWCKSYVHYRKGEGLKLFEKPKEAKK